MDVGSTENVKYSKKIITITVKKQMQTINN